MNSAFLNCITDYANKKFLIWNIANLIAELMHFSSKKNLNRWYTDGWWLRIDCKEPNSRLPP